MPTEVSITVDVEFDINGAFGHPESRQPVGLDSLHCFVDGEDCGLGFIMDTLEAHGLRGTFFVEALNTAYFGDEPMGSVATAIRDRGHDVQLHLHPVWTTFDDPDWVQTVRGRRIVASKDDSFAALDVAAARTLIRRGMNTFARWGLAKPIAVRTGGLLVGNAFYDALEQEGVPISSSVGYALFQPAPERLALYSGIHRVNAITEVPITTFLDLNVLALRHMSLATIIGSGYQHIRSILSQARRGGPSPIIVLTHATEFIRRTDDGYGTVRRRSYTRNRLRKICRYLADRRDDFDVVTFADRQADWRQRQSTSNDLLSAPPQALLFRFAEELLAK